MVTEQTSFTFFQGDLGHLTQNAEPSSTITILVNKPILEKILLLAEIDVCTKVNLRKEKRLPTKKLSKKLKDD